MRLDLVVATGCTPSASAEEQQKRRLAVEVDLQADTASMLVGVPPTFVDNQS
jgi:hypothetical protein